MEPDPGLLEYLPPAWLALAHEWAPYVLGTLVLTTLAAWLLLPLARKFEAWALTTSVEWDNKVASLVIVALGWIVATSATLLEWLPRFVMGPGERDTKPTKVHRAGTLIEPSTPPPPAPPDPPLGGAGLALALVVLAAALSVATNGCGASAFELQVQIAAAAEDTAAETRELVRTYRTNAMRAAARAVYEAGGDEQAATDAARAKGAELAPLVEAQRLYALASHGYVDALDLSGGNLAAEAVKAALRGVLDAYRHLRRLGAELGVDELASLPATPSWLDGLLPPQLLAPDGAQEDGAR